MDNKKIKGCVIKVMIFFTILLLIIGAIIFSFTLVINIINSGAYVTDRAPGAGLDMPMEGYCDLDPNTIIPLEFPNIYPPTNIAHHAYILVNDLLPGLWCYFNHQPYYDGDAPSDPPGFPDGGNPDYWDETLFGLFLDNDGTYNIFWCTIMVIEAWNNTPGVSLPTDLIYTPTMHAYFVNTGRFTTIQQALQNLSLVHPGDAAIIARDGSSRGLNGDHASIVWSVTPDAITTIDSNAGLKGFTYAISGGEARWGSLTIVGFGRR